jgi:hypothetical protein
MHKLLALLVFGALAVPLSQAQAGGTPDLSGTWNINAAKSDFGQAPAPSKQSEVITQNGNDFTFKISSTSDMGSQDYTFSVKADGIETPFPANALPADTPFKIVSTSAKWDGPALVVTEKTSFQDSPGTLTATYTLSPDGKVLTKDSKINASMGEFDMKAVYDKQ